MRLISKVNGWILTTDNTLQFFKKGENYYCEDKGTFIKVYSTFLKYSIITKENMYDYFYTNFELRKMKLEKLDERN